jgi:DNA-directed RNA polymerase specialized sigma24 family protein
MMAGPDCGCLICRLEASLIAELSGDRENEEFRLFVASRPTLAVFPNALELIRHLHRQDRDQSPHSDRLLLDLLARSSQLPFGPLRQRLLLLAFVPTLHRTTSQITVTFPSLTRDDTAQHLFTVLLEYLPSNELQSRRSHLAFTIARKVRRGGFRWAIRECRSSLRNEPDGTPTTSLETGVTDVYTASHILLRRFLDNCQHRGWLSSEERELLSQFKLEGIPSQELARRSGRSAVAIRHRIQRLLDRLRRIAGKSETRISDQLDLFTR